MLRGWSRSIPDRRLVSDIRSGPDGAELVLLDVIDHEHVRKRFTHLMIASGDGVFSAAARLGAAESGWR